jgi:phosphate transport system substrate-binding protein
VAKGRKDGGGTEERRRHRDDQADARCHRLYRIWLCQAHQGGLAQLQNKSGNYVAASDKSGAATLATAVLGPDLRGWIEDPAGADAYPIATFTWLLAYKRQDAKKAEWMRKLVDYCVTKGQSISDSMGYIPLPTSVVEKIKTASAQIQ